MKFYTHLHRYRMFLGMQNFDFAHHFFPNFASILPKFQLNFAQIQPNLPKKFLLGRYSCFPCISSSYGTAYWSYRYVVSLVYIFSEER